MIFRLFIALAGALLLLACGGGETDTTNTSTEIPTPPSGNISIESPTLIFTASPEIVEPGQYTNLSWSSSNTTTCLATGSWSGDKTTTGNENSGPISTAQTFTLTCYGSSGNVTKSLTVSVAGSNAISGLVDSGHVDRNGTNAIYVYTGTVTPDDIEGDAGDPIMVVPVSQLDNSCDWNYALPELPGGEYTLAVTNEAHLDLPQNDDAIHYSAVEYVSVDSTPIRLDFAANNIIRVGPGRPLTTPSMAAAVASSGDVIEIDAGLYQDDVAVWRQDNLTLRAVDGRAHIQATRIIPYTPGDDQENGMGIWVTRGKNIKVENMEFSGAAVPDQNGAGIRAIGPDLTICNSYFHDNENGILGGEAGHLLIEYSEFNHNGLGEYGRTHNIYVNPDKFTLRHSYSHHANVGHNVKSRARENYLLYNRIMDEQDGNSSYGIDIPNGGTTFIIGNLVQQGTNSDNSILVNYGAEGLLSDRSHRLYMVNNTLVNDRGNGTIIDINAGTESARLVNNLLLGGGTPVSGSAELVSNLVTADAGLVDRTNFDYRLTASSPARDAGIVPGLAEGVNMSPVFHYVNDALREARPLDGPVDIGAYEYHSN